MNLTPQQILNTTSTMSIDELLQLNSDLVALIKHRQKMTAKDMKSVLSVGDTVTFRSRSGKVTGAITKIMRTRAQVKVKGCTWKVPLNMLSLAC